MHEIKKLNLLKDFYKNHFDYRLNHFTKEVQGWIIKNLANDFFINEFEIKSFTLWVVLIIEYKNISSSKIIILPDYIYEQL